MFNPVVRYQNWKCLVLTILNVFNVTQCLYVLSFDQVENFQQILVWVGFVSVLGSVMILKVVQRKVIFIGGFLLISVCHGVTGYFFQVEAYKNAFISCCVSLFVQSSLNTAIIIEVTDCCLPNAIGLINFIKIKHV